MSIDARLNKLTPYLSAQERAILVLRSMKDKTPEDPLWRTLMPTDQVREFNRLIELMNIANREFAFLIAMIEKEFEKLELRSAWLYTLHLWRYNLADINFTASLVSREPITESEHAKLVEAAKDDYILASQLAVVLAEEKRSWSDDDLEEVGWTRELVVKPESWQRLQSEAEAEIRAAVEAGTLEARGSGKKLAVKRSSFDAWLGRPVTVYPRWAGNYLVLPDEREAHVLADRHTLEHLRQALEETPITSDLLERDNGSNLDALVAALTTALQRGLERYWAELVATEHVLEQIAAEFEGEDPLKPHSRAGLQKARRSAEDLAVLLEAFGKPATLGEPDEQEVASLRGMVERNGGFFRQS